MYIDRILFPIETLGPGNRIVVWTRGCSKHCKNCANPELWTTDGSKNILPSELARIILNICKESKVDGITFTGGDPLEQDAELLQVLKSIKNEINDVLVYTGFEYSDYIFMRSKDSVQELETLVSVLIDGQYVHKLNDNATALRGSTNQNIIYFDDTQKEKYSDYISNGRKIQNVLMGSKFISVGIHNK